MFANLMDWRTLIVLLLAWFLGGCQLASETANQREVGFRYGTEFTFFSRAAATSPEVATDKVTLTVDDRVLDSALGAAKKEEEEPDPANP